EVPVRLRLEVEPARLAPRPLDPVGALVAASGDRVLWCVRDSLLRRRQLGFHPLGLGLEVTKLLLEGFHLGQRLGVRPAAHRRELVASAALLLQPRDERSALRVERDEAVEARAREALRKFGQQTLRVLT